MPPATNETTPAIPERMAGDRFRHEALFYAGLESFVSQVGPFIREGVDAGEPVLVVVELEKIQALRRSLGDRGGRVRFEDMRRLGGNPARIIPAWQAFVDEQATAGPFRGVGEPIWAGRAPSELVECGVHEALLNVAFDGGPAWRLLCPYDAAGLADPVLAEARRNHPFVREHGDLTSSAEYRGTADVAGQLGSAPLPEPPLGLPIRHVAVRRSGLGAIRAMVAEEAATRGLRPQRTQELVLAVSEVATNSIRHGSGDTTARVWSHHDTIVVDVRDGGWIRDPMVGRRKPSDRGAGGYGLWLVNHLCDLVQIRSTRAGTTVRLHVRA